MSSRPKMVSIWDDVFPSEWDNYDSNITEVLFCSQPLESRYTPSKNVGTLEIFFDIFPFDADDNQGQTMHRKIVAEGAYVFFFPPREFLVGQMLKAIDIYPDIIRFDIKTTGSLLSFECDSYSIDDQ